MKQKKLIIFFPSIEEGGVEKNLFVISDFLSKKIKNISIITSVPNKIDNNKIKIIKSNLNIQNKSRFIKNLFCSFLLMKEIIKNKKVIVISFQANLYATLITWFFGVNIICRANASIKGWLKNPIKKLIYKTIIKLSSKIIVNSKAMKSEFKKDLNLNSFLIYNPLDKKKILANSKKKINLSFFNNKKYLKILNIGRLTDQKDQITLLKAANLLKRKLKFKLILLGQGSEKKRFENYIDNNGLNKNIKILNFKKNPYPIIKKTDLFILTSKYEGLPNVLLEAIVLKKLIISSDCPTGPREILQNGKGGILFKTRSYLDLYNISRSTAAHSTLTLDNTSVSKFKKNKFGNYYIENNYKIFNKKIIFEKDQWVLSSSHDGYQNRYGLIHERNLEFNPNKNILIGKDRLIKKKNYKATNFDLRFHLALNSKVTKTQNGKVILIELDNSGWKFTCNKYSIDIETGLYFGRKNLFVENQNIFISGLTQNEEQTIFWKIEKI